MLDYIMLSRPRFWIYLFGPFLIGLVAAANTNPSVFQIILVIVFGLLFLFPANLYVYGVNDIHDQETDKHNPKKKSYEKLLESKHLPTLNMLLGAILALSLGLTVIFLDNIRLQVALFCFFLLAHFYSTPPLRAKSKPFLDMTFNALYVMPGLVGYFILSAGAVRYDLVLAAIFWAMAMHAYSAIPDIDSDKKAKLSTTATTLGVIPTLVLCASLYVLSAFLAYSTLGITALLLGVFYVGLMVYSFVQRSSIVTVYTYFPYFNLIAGFVLFLVTFSLRIWRP